MAAYWLLVFALYFFLYFVILFFCFRKTDEFFFYGKEITIMERMAFYCFCFCDCALCFGFEFSLCFWGCLVFVALYILCASMICVYLMPVQNCCMLYEYVRV